ncbi:MAG: sensor domain-containing protein [Mycobacterium sp.]|nr:MAG: sensor domain-containing protein [Mycobacterium sp.]
MNDDHRGWPPVPGPGRGMGGRPNLPPGWPVGHEWPDPVPEAPRKDLRWWIVAGGVAAVVILIGGGILVSRNGSGGAGVAASVSSEASTSEPVPTTSRSQAVSGWRLSELLASQQMLSDHADHAPLTLAPVVSKPFANVTITPVQCTSAVVPGDPGTYGISNMTGFAGQSAADDSPDGGHKIIQAIAAFPTDSDASGFFDMQLSEWQRCASMSMSSATADGAVTSGDVGTPAVTNGVATVSITPTDAPAGGRSCQHALTHRATFVVDVRVCAPHVGDSGSALAQAISGAIPR